MTDIREKISKLIQDNSMNLMDSTITGANMPTRTWAEVAGQILALVREAGYVKLADDQSLPYLTRDDPDLESRLNYAVDMKRRGWRKVELEEDNGS